MATTATIEWWTDVAGNSTVEYGLTTGLGSSVTVTQAASCEVGSAGTCHVVPLTGLQPNTRYYYQLRTNGQIVQPVSTTTYFTTVLSPGDPGDIFFTVIGDWGQATSGESAIASLQDAADPPMIVTVGDNAYQNGTQSDWDNNALPYYQNPMQRMLFMPTLGNHDVNSSGVSGWANSAEIKTFLLPRNGTEQERYYSYDSGDVHFVILDSNSVSSTETTWLTNDLASTTRRWKFVFLHHTPYSCANGIASIGSNTTVRNTWGPIFEQNQVDVVFTGHDHIYERTHLMDDFGADGLGTTYVMTGGGGATLDSAANLDGNGNPVRTPLFGSTQQCYWLSQTCPGGPNNYCSFSRYEYVSVHIAGDSAMTLQGIGSDGSVFDTFTITKSAPTTTTTTTSTTTSTTTTTTTTSTTATTTTTTTTTTEPTTTTTTTTTEPTTTTTTTEPTTTTSTTTTTTVPTTTTTTTTSTTSTSTTTATTTTTTSTTTTTTSTTTLAPTSTTTTTTSSTTTSTATTTTTSSTTTTSTTTTSTSTTTTTTVPCVPVVAGRLSLGRLSPPPGDESLGFSGSATLPVPFDPPLDPVHNGVRIVVDDPSLAVVVDETVPGVAYDAGTRQGWTASASGWRWRSHTGPITKVGIKTSPKVPGGLRFSVKGRNGTWAATPAELPLRATLVLDPPDAPGGQCAATAFGGTSCAFTGSGTTLRCR